MEYNRAMLYTVQYTAPLFYCIKLYLISGAAHHVQFQQFWVEVLKQVFSTYH